jgi:hypothetical protein
MGTTGSPDLVLEVVGHGDAWYTSIMERIRFLVRSAGIAVLIFVLWWYHFARTFMRAPPDFRPGPEPDIGLLDRVVAATDWALYAMGAPVPTAQIANPALSGGFVVRTPVASWPWLPNGRSSR